MMLRFLLKPMIFMVCLIPLLWLVYAAVFQRLGANPIETITHVTGEWALRILLLCLLMTPLKHWLRQSWPLRLRRMLGLFAAAYASLHFLAYGWLDLSWSGTAILEDILERPYVTLGFTAFLLLLPLLMTSTRWAQRKLGRRWSALHRSVYWVSLAAVLHLFWLTKADFLEPTLYLGVLLLLLVDRFMRLLRTS